MYCSLIPKFGTQQFCNIGQTNQESFMKFGIQHIIFQCFRSRLILILICLLYNTNPSSNMVGQQTERQHQNTVLCVDTSFPSIWKTFTTVMHWTEKCNNAVIMWTDSEINTERTGNCKTYFLLNVFYKCLQAQQLV